jgi:hypothetical protein
MPHENGRPKAAAPGLDTDESSSPLHIVRHVAGIGPYSVADAALGAAIVATIRELRPNLPIPVARSLAVEIIDKAKADATWLEIRAATDSHVLAASRNLHIGHSYATRREEELSNALDSRPGDYLGRGQVA